MRVLQFAFDGEPDNEHLPERHVENCVAYSGTHDNDTLPGWLAGGVAAARPPEEAARERARFLRWLGRERRRRGSEELVWSALELLEKSPASAVILPLQDVLGLGSDARMNTPGTAEGNWAWRFRWRDLSPERKARVRAISRQGRGR
jgi:4-alpha-glucanotransferase